MVNDTSIIFGIIIFFVALGTLLPFVTSAFGEDTVTNQDLSELTEFESTIIFENNTEVCTENPYRFLGFLPIGTEVSCYQKVDGEVVVPRSVNWAVVIFSIAKMFFWSFSQVPLLLELLFLLPLRVLLAFLIYRSIRSGGG